LQLEYRSHCSLPIAPQFKNKTPFFKFQRPDRRVENLFSIRGGATTALLKK